MRRWFTIRGHSVASALVLTTAVLSYARPASACSAPACWSSQFVPADGAVVPSNLVGMLWRPNPADSTIGATAADFSLFRVEGSNETPVSVTVSEVDWGLFFVAPDEPFAEDATYRVSAERLCPGDPTLDPATLELSATPAAGAPGALGTLTASDPFQGSLQVATWDGSCYREIDAVQVRVAIELSSSAEPWSDALVWSTWVDGEPYSPIASMGSMSYDPPPPGASWQGRGEDLIFASCDGIPYQDQGVEEGPHTVQLRAGWPSPSALVPQWESDEIEIELSCATSSMTDAGAGGSSAASASPDGSGGCGCRAAPRRAAGWSGWL
ncbi:MAG: hypothetical protein JRI55_10675, partial [Deltaproteobacteria bacterium]|nr:hypothetical protein [Deltaproteobacteria bacterium]